MRMRLVQLCTPFVLPCVDLAVLGFVAHDVDVVCVAIRFRFGAFRVRFYHCVTHDVLFLCVCGVMVASAFKFVEQAFARGGRRACAASAEHTCL